MIRKLAGEIELVCDECGTEGPAYDEDHFETMISDTKADGWSITRPEGRWEHKCRDCCAEVSALDRAKRKFGLR